MLPNWAEITLQVAAIGAVALVAYVAVRSAARISGRHLLERRARQRGGEALQRAELERRIRTLEGLAERIAAIVIGVIATLMVLDLFAINIGPAVAGLGVVGIAVGLGAQTLIRDWLAGIFVVIENQYSEGDVVRIAGVEGVVEDISLRRTVLRDLDNTMHSVPNGAITVASNTTRLWSPLELEIQVAPDADTDAASAIVNEIGAELQADPDWTARILAAPMVAHTWRGESGASLHVSGQVRSVDHLAARAELQKRVTDALDRAGIRRAED
ncbi:MAG: mechanosensitive ion channel family protein [Chloroflexota bacterium]|nr:mechanosensitive ion channel family protein [Chloroflexota bacterium]